MIHSVASRNGQAEPSELAYVDEVPVSGLAVGSAEMYTGLALELGHSDGLAARVLFVVGALTTAASFMAPMATDYAARLRPTRLQ